MRSTDGRQGGFTLVELMVTLAILAVLAAAAVGGLGAYLRLARFERNEAAAQTVLQAAQEALAHREAAGTLDAFTAQVTACGEVGGHFDPNADYGTGARNSPAALDAAIYALYYDRSDPDTAQGQLAAALLGPYLYDASLLDASLCLEIDSETGQVYAVFYDAASDRLRFGGGDGATDLYDRSYDHRRTVTQVGYCTAGRAQANTPQPVQLQVHGVRLVNGETLTLHWRGASADADETTIYIVTLYAADAEGQPTDEKLFSIEITRAALAEGQTAADLPVTRYDTDGTAQPAENYAFPLQCDGDRFALTLDAMMDAASLRAAENDPAAARDGLYSIARFTAAPRDVVAGVSARPGADDASHLPGEEAFSNAENTLFARGGTAASASLTCFRHLYNLRWVDGLAGRYTLRGLLDWTGGGVTVYCAATKSGEPPQAAMPTADQPVAWPMVPRLGAGSTLAGATGSSIRHLQLRGSSVAAVGRGGQTALRDQWIGLIGQNDGTLQNLMLCGPDVLVNAAVQPLAAGETLPAGALPLGNTACLAALAPGAPDYRGGLRGVGALCGLSTGTVRGCAVTADPATTSRVAAALAPENAQDTAKSYTRTLYSGVTGQSRRATFYSAGPCGVGGLAGVLLPGASAQIEDLSTGTGVTVAGILSTFEGTDAQQDGEAALAAAVTGRRALGVGGVTGVLDADALSGELALQNAAAVTGTACTGGVAGQIYGTGAALGGLVNTGTVTPGAADGLLFGGVAGYVGGVTLQNCRSDAQIGAADSGIFVGGAVGLAEGDQLVDCRAAGAQGQRFVGGLAGALDAGSTLTAAQTLTLTAAGGETVGGAVGLNAGTVTLGEVRATVTAQQTAGGLAGENQGAILGAVLTDSTIKSDSGTLGGTVGVNGAQATIQNVTLQNNTGTVRLAGTATEIGGLAGRSAGTVQACAVEAGALDPSGLTAAEGTVTFGGAVGVNTGLVQAEVNAEITRNLSVYQYIGGVAGQNDGTLQGCTFRGVIGTETPLQGAACAAAGGIAGRNAGTVQGCAVPRLTLCLAGGADSAVGGIAGQNDGTLTNCTTGEAADCRVTAGAGCVGGLVGHSTGALQDLTNRAAVRLQGDTGSAGGVVGAQGAAALSGCTNLGPVAGGGCTGGIAGSAACLQIENCQNRGALSPAPGGTAGGIVGVLAPADAGDAEVTNCENTGAIAAEGETPAAAAGGVLGRAVLPGGTLTVRDCVAHAATIRADTAGGIAANVEAAASLTLDRCRSYATLEGALCAGIVGGCPAGTAVTDCFALAGSGEGQYPIAGTSITARGNFYLDDVSFAYCAGGLAPVGTAAPTGTVGGDGLPERTADARRLYAVADAVDGLAVLLPLTADGTATAFDPATLPGAARLCTLDGVTCLADAADEVLGRALFRFADTDADGTLTMADVTDAALQPYYATLSPIATPETATPETATPETAAA